MQEQEDTADDLRQKGNHEFQQGNLDNAIVFYTAAITKGNKAEQIVNSCNRSACYYQLEEYEQARDDALQAWELSGRSNVKAAYRLSKTYLALKEATKALNVLKTAMQLTTLSKKELDSLKELEQQTKKLQSTPMVNETTIKGVDRPISIREFTVTKTLGVGNFSEICIALHKDTGAWFALKKLEKKQAADLAKRQHPNVYNEIQMEARVLMDRLPPHPHIIQMYHSFQDYNTLYYLMDLHNINLDLWSQIRYKGSMVGCRESQIKRWVLQVISALEHMHAHGIVHRDLKPENILLNQNNHVVVIDLGTAKDLVKTDLNGPEFVGTPDFMSPEAVTGFSGMPKPDHVPDKEKNEATHCADLWALGALISILHTGSTPYWSPSPFLTFLKIKRGLLTRPWGLPDDDCWDLIVQLMQVNPNKRLGADCYKVEDGKVTVQKGYDVIRAHKYFDKVTQNDASHSIPSLQDLCLLAVVDQAKKEALDLDLCDQHPPGDGSKHDLTRLSPKQRSSVLHILDKMKTFANGDETRVLQRFFEKPVDFLKAKVRLTSRDFVGLTPMNDDEYKPQSARGSADPYAKKDAPQPTKLVILSSPLFLGPVEDESLQKRYIKGLKACIAQINKTRPKAVIVLGHISAKVWKLLARIRDSIQVLWADGSVHYSFWLNGFQGMLLNSGDLAEDSIQTLWIRQEMEQSRMAKPQLFVFCNGDPRQLPPMILKKLARGRVLWVMGMAHEDIDTTVEYQPNETLDDGASVKSTDSVEDADEASTMRMIAGSQNGIRWLTVEESAEYTAGFEAIPLSEE